MNIRLEQPRLHPRIGSGDGGGWMDYLPQESEVPYFLAQELIPGYWGNREDSYYPPKGYFVADEHSEAFEAYEATFPKKEKLHLPEQLV